jgi:hypothetical protein
VSAIASPLQSHTGALSGSDSTPREKSCQSPLVDKKACALDTVRRAVSEEGWGPVSLSAHLGHDKSYVSRVLNGESPLNVSFILKLPKPVLRRIAKAWAEYYGYVVIEPDTDQNSAMRNMLRGLLHLVDLKMLKAEPQAHNNERKVG